MSLFFFQDRIDKTIYFDEEISHHMVRSLRKKPGDIIHATDGRGLILTGTIDQMEGKRLQAVISDEKHQIQKHQITIACSLIKSENRFEIFLEKATEMGVFEIIPLICQRTIKPRIRMSRSEKIIKAAAQQSFNPHLPILRPATSFDDFIEESFPDHERFIATAVDRHEALPMERAFSGQNPIVIMIGPEGDFTEEEKEKAINVSWTPVSLGSTRLRTETAAISSVQIAKSCYNFNQSK